MFVMHFSRISTHYSGRLTLQVFLWSVHCGWNSHLMKLLLAMTKLSWLGAVFQFKGSIQRCFNQFPYTYMFSFCKTISFFLWSLTKVFIMLCCSQRAKHASVYLPGKQSWYDLRTGAVYKGGVTHKLEVTEESIPAFQRAGTIIARKDRFRRSSTQMANDPYTLVCVHVDLLQFLCI